MINFLVALALLLLLCSGCLAAPIIGGQITLTPGASSYNLVGPWFDITFLGRPPVLGGYMPFLRCESGCVEGEVVPLVGGDGGDELSYGFGTVKGVSYPILNFGRDDVALHSTHFDLLADPITVSRNLVHRVPFFFSGRLVAFEGLAPGTACVICAPGTEDLDPFFTDKTIPINGRGTITVTFDAAVPSDFGPLFFINNMTYEFVAIPEPGTGSYVAASVLLLCIARQVKKLARRRLVS